ncbi:S-methyl-5-thioribose-1-phosphate isomerase [Macrococcus brunensis]|uniref:S-methyl-5-thioribose-1-phosphate isomerase n=1 Tax=Macrococcus brunensis TaxID=198483 RepID=UPI001EF0133B|nr:S-methyl-5-thioribose-1-phosphate isomerase [Macrococcus brunensis]ULG71803.1 S-methyl-5-thioribose-1-phosphate isomerase [Macrococcus brunensis]ULG74061.1 S-methyl-5-thioribose-1-phosphate isomerase [Macrococcus brunensis]
MKAISYKDGKLTLLDQTQLPHQTTHITYTEHEKIARAIEDMVVRGAPAIGITAAYGVAVGAREYQRGSFKEHMTRVIERLQHTRPTAVNLHWALKRVHAVVTDHPAETIQALEQEAERIFEEDQAINLAIGQHLKRLVTESSAFLIHCNPGRLATSDYGTATAPFYLAHAEGVKFKVYSDETRPRLQGALTAYELSEAGIDVTVITDSTAATLMQQGKITAVFVGCDRVAANGDVVNKIGTLPLAIAAHYFKVPFYVAAPTPTFDLTIEDGSHIPIEERHATEVTHIREQLVTIEGTVYNPAFDVTPAALITGIVTEHGEIEPTYEAIKNLFSKGEKE